MRRWLILLSSSVMAVAMYACGGAPAPASSSSGDVCPLVSAGPPAVCPAGCAWNGTECRKKEGVIMVDAVEAGAPPPVAK